MLLITYLLTHKNMLLITSTDYIEYGERELASETVYKFLAETKQGIKEVERDGYFDGSHKQRIRTGISNLKRQYTRKRLLDEVQSRETERSVRMKRP